MELFELQQDLDDIELRLKKITDDLDELKTKFSQLNKGNQCEIFDFDKIEYLSKKYSFGKHPLGKLQDGYACQLYLEMILHLMSYELDPDSLAEKMVFIQWLQIQACIDWSLKELYLESTNITKENYYELVDLLTPKYRESLIVDLLIVANMNGKANQEALIYICNLASIMCISKARVEKLAVVASFVLCQRISVFTRKEKIILLDMKSQFEHYLKIM